MKRDAGTTRCTFPPLASTFLAGLALVGALAGCSMEETGGMAGDGGDSSGPAINKLDAGSGAASTDVQAVAVEHQELHETVQIHTVKSPRLAQQIYEAYLQGEAGEVTDMRAADYDDNLIFTMSDGSVVSVTFNAHNLVDGDVVREFDDKGGLWKLLAQMDD